MESRCLGRSGLKLSAVSYGNWASGDPARIERSEQLVQVALDCGITTFDTADSYGPHVAECTLGNALKAVRRESVVICTKVYFPSVPNPGPNDSGLSRKHIRESIDGSLRRLGTDYVDLYQTHRYDFGTPLEETIEALGDVLRSGKALYIGVSEWNADQLVHGQTLAREAGFRLVSNQPQYSLLWRVIEPDVIPTSEALGISQLAWSPLAQGVLSGKYGPGNDVPKDSRAAQRTTLSQFLDRWLHPAVLADVQQLKAVAADVGLSLAQLSIAWVLQNRNVTTAIVGASRPAHLKEAAKASGVVLPLEVMASAERIIGPHAVTDPAINPFNWTCAPKNHGRGEGARTIGDACDSTTAS